MGIGSKAQWIFPKFDPPFDLKSGSKGQSMTPDFIYTNKIVLCMWLTGWVCLTTYLLLNEATYRDE